MRHTPPFDIEKEINSIFTGYVKVPSYTNTPQEKWVEPFLTSWFTDQDYFSTHPEYWGGHPCLNDPLDRRVIWGMVKGKGQDTIVLVHHYDVVEIEEYDTAKPFAHDVSRINHEIRSLFHKFDREAIEDLESGAWQFGRGTADMKAGGAIQLALLKQYSLDPDFTGNLIVLCLPDEENLSVGMRSAIDLLDGLKQQFSLEYKLMINSEPHQSLNAQCGIVYEGSVGKLMPVVYARGSLAHVGRIFEGFNPLHLISELIIHTDLNMDFSDIAGEEATPPPSWLYLKDQKQHYDVSIPTKVWAYLSVLTLHTQPDELLAKLKSASEHAFATVIERMNHSYNRYREATHQPGKKLPWQVNVKTFSQLFWEVSKTGKRDFLSAYQEKLGQMNAAVVNGSKTLVEASFELIEFCLQFSKDTSPLIVIGLSPPYYPGVTNSNFLNLETNIRQLSGKINQFSMDLWQQPYLAQKYFMGISDLSYSSILDDRALDASVCGNMPLWGDAYQIPFEKIGKINMPCLNIGPWGKDFHKITERVCIEDLYKRTPKIVSFVIREILD